MKRFSIISLLLLCTSAAFSCAIEGNSFNHYLFSVFPREQMGNIFRARVDSFWVAYTNGEIETYSIYNGDEVLEFAKRKGDSEMAAYVEWLNKYLELSNDMKESWDYPTKEELSKRKVILKEIGDAAKAYTGNRLRPQYALLQMRSNLLLGLNMENKRFWEQTASKMPHSVYRDMMLNIYAGSLLRLGQRQKACEIYAMQEDMQSIKWCTMKYRNLAGIKAVYKENPQSPTLRWLIQDFINNLQETYDQSEDREMIEYVGAKPVYEKDAKEFIRFAKEVLSSEESNEPCLWESAIGCIHLLLGDNESALIELSAAMSLAGTARMHDNARAIHAIAMANAMPIGEKLSRFITNELLWLDQKSKEERNYRDIYENHYTDIKERLIYHSLIVKYMQNNRFEVATAFMGMIEDDSLPYEYWNPRSQNFSGYEYAGNSDYSTLYFDRLDSLSADQLIQYYSFLQSNPEDVLESFLVKRVYNDSIYYFDLIGTKLIAEGRFDEAVPYLEKVPLTFLNRQNICRYMALRDFRVPRWERHQIVGSDYDSMERVQLTDNPKLKFCREMLALQSQYLLAGSDDIRQNLAYQLAVRYYQASYLGDCWYLTHYGSLNDFSGRMNEKDYVVAAVDYLQQSSQSEDFTTKMWSFYALAFIETDPWCDSNWCYDEETESYETVYLPHFFSRQYSAYRQLSEFVDSHAGIIPPFISHCDVLRDFQEVDKYNYFNVLLTSYSPIHNQQQEGL